MLCLKVGEGQNVDIKINHTLAFSDLLSGQMEVYFGADVDLEHV